VGGDARVLLVLVVVVIMVVIVVGLLLGLRWLFDVLSGMQTAIYLVVWWLSVWVGHQRHLTALNPVAMSACSAAICQC
jgi:hypothetical protein